MRLFMKIHKAIIMFCKFTKFMMNFFKLYTHKP